MTMMKRKGRKEDNKYVRLRRNYPYGRNSKRYCLHCGELIERPYARIAATGEVHANCLEVYLIARGMNRAQAKAIYENILWRAID